MISKITTLHFAPTTNARHNLINEGHSSDTIFQTGNTVVDTLRLALKGNPPSMVDTILSKIPPNRQNIILVTCHRRESWGQPLIQLCQTLKKFVYNYPKNVVIWPVHGNPQVADTVNKELKGVGGVILTEALPYLTFINLLNLSHILITDSGGVLEEAASLDLPTIVLRDETERPEALASPKIRLVGHDFDKLYNLLKKKPPKKYDVTNDVFGDGHAGERIGKVVVQYLEEGKKNE